jgi:hypothetical protein
MMEFNITSNIADWTKELEQVYQRQIPFATATALNATVDDLKAHHQTILPAIFDRPTRWTINSLQRQKATSRGSLEAGISFKYAPGHRKHYLVPQVVGGARPHKPFEKWLIARGIMMQSEYAVPTSGARLNVNGNMSQGMIVQILSQLAAGPEASLWETAKSRKRAGASRQRYFVPQASSSLKRGVWQRTGKRQIKPVLLFVSAPTYAKRYAFYDISRERSDFLFPRYFELAMRAGIADQDAHIARNR